MILDEKDYLKLKLTGVLDDSKATVLNSSDNVIVFVKGNFVQFIVRDDKHGNIYLEMHTFNDGIRVRYLGRFSVRVLVRYDCLSGDGFFNAMILNAEWSGMYNPECVFDFKGHRFTKLYLTDGLNIEVVTDNEQYGVNIGINLDNNTISEIVVPDMSILALS